MTIRFEVDAVENGRLEKLYEVLDKNRGECALTFEVKMDDGSVARIQPNQHVRVKVTEELTDSISNLLPGCDIKLIVERAITVAR